MYLDVDVLYALLKENDYHKEYALRVARAPGRKYTSIIALVELEIIVKREISDTMSLSINQIVTRLLPNLKIISLENEHFVKSLELRTKYGLGIFDSLHVAVCLSQDKEIASTDHAFTRIPGLSIVK